MNNTTYVGSGGSKVIVKNGIVTTSDCPQYCAVGQKPNLDFLRKCGWKKSKPAKQYFIGPLSDGKGNRING